jgi:hypothetical protein
MSSTSTVGSATVDSLTDIPLLSVSDARAAMLANGSPDVDPPRTASAGSQRRQHLPRGPAPRPEGAFHRAVVIAGGMLAGERETPNRFGEHAAP